MSFSQEGQTGGVSHRPHLRVRLRRAVPAIRNVLLAVRTRPRAADQPGNVSNARAWAYLESDPFCRLRARDVLQINDHTDTQTDSQAAKSKVMADLVGGRK